MNKYKNKMTLQNPLTNCTQSFDINYNKLQITYPQSNVNETMEHME